MKVLNDLQMEQEKDILRYPDLEDRFFFSNRVISVISVVLRETSPIILDSTGEPVSIESDIVRVVSLSTTEIPEITRLKSRSSGSGFLKLICYGMNQSPGVLISGSNASK